MLPKYLTPDPLLASVPPPRPSLATAGVAIRNLTSLSFVDEFGVAVFVVIEDVPILNLGVVASASVALWNGNVVVDDVALWNVTVLLCLLVAVVVLDETKVVAPTRTDLMVVPAAAAEDPSSVVAAKETRFAAAEAAATAAASLFSSSKVSLAISCPFKVCTGIVIAA